MEQLNTNVSGGITRIEAVNDPNVNRALFTIYKNLVNPMKSLEQTLKELDETNSDILYFKSATSVDWGGVSNMAIKFALGALAAFLILGIFGVDTLPGFLDVINSMGLIKGGLCLLIIGGVIGAVVEILRTSATRADKKTKLAEAEKYRDNLMRTKERIIDSIREVICYVPPKYRFSEALAYFAESYENSRVDNLKEAVNLFDTHAFREKNLKLLSEIADSLDDIAFNQIQIIDQLKNIRSDIWLSGFIYS